MRRSTFGFWTTNWPALGLPALSPERMIDTLVLAKTRFSWHAQQPDALCRRFAIDLSQRKTHNALLDCRLLAEVYVELTGRSPARSGLCGRRVHRAGRNLRPHRTAHPPPGGAE